MPSRPLPGPHWRSPRCAAVVVADAPTEYDRGRRRAVARGRHRAHVCRTVDTPLPRRSRWRTRSRCRPAAVRGERHFEITLLGRPSVGAVREATTPPCDMDGSFLAVRSSGPRQLYTTTDPLPQRHDRDGQRCRALCRGPASSLVVAPARPAPRSPRPPRAARSRRRRPPSEVEQGPLGGRQRREDDPDIWETRLSTPAHDRCGGDSSGSGVTLASPISSKKRPSAGQRRGHAVGRNEPRWFHDVACRPPRCPRR